MRSPAYRRDPACPCGLCQPLSMHWTVRLRAALRDHAGVGLMLLFAAVLVLA